MKKDIEEALIILSTYAIVNDNMTDESQSLIDSINKVKQTFKDLKNNIATVNGELTSDYLLEFESKKGTPNNESEQEYLEVINIARGHLQHYEKLLSEVKE